MSYCEYCENLTEDNLHKIYHDNHYGFIITSDNELFGRLLLEINQAGLSWDTILKKQNGFRLLYDQFDIAVVANYSEDKIQELLSDSRIIRNKLKVNAAVYNAQQILLLKKEFGSFKAWLDMHNPKTLDEWTKIFKKTFKFVGGEIVNEFLMSTGYLPGAHKENCEIYKKVELFNAKMT